MLLPSFTFVATSLAVDWAGYEPVFCDIDPATWQPSIDPDAFAERADDLALVVLCSTFGAPFAPGVRASLVSLAERHGVPLVVDSAAALGGDREDGGKTGGAGLSEVFSLHATKPAAGIEGGAVVTGDAALAARIANLGNFALDENGTVAGRGLNGKISEIHAAVALRSLRRLDAAVARRRRVAARYRDGLVPLGFRFQSAGELSPYQFVPARVPAGVDRDALIAALAARGIEARAYFSRPLHAERRYAECDHVGTLTATELVARDIVSLPMAEDLSQAEVEEVIAAIERFVTGG